MKYFSSGFRDSQCCRSLDRSTYTRVRAAETCARTPGLPCTEAQPRGATPQRAVGEPVEVHQHRGTPHLLRRPEGGLGLLVHLPDVMVLDGENDEPPGVLSQQRFLLRAPRHLRGTQSGSGRHRAAGSRAGRRGGAAPSRSRPPPPRPPPGAALRPRRNRRPRRGRQRGIWGRLEAAGSSRWRRRTGR